ncbi:hypothetical protein LX36DRAFT_119159 [Colletotrichum falcatum]|nr:hypothetical protein LX36DRAFT_119159 [Colletotrichum falcatum]
MLFPPLLPEQPPQRIGKSNGRWRWGETTSQQESISSVACIFLPTAPYRPVIHGRVPKMPPHKRIHTSFAHISKRRCPRQLQAAWPCRQPARQPASSAQILMSSHESRTCQASASTCRLWHCSPPQLNRCVLDPFQDFQLPGRHFGSRANLAPNGNGHAHCRVPTPPVTHFRRQAQQISVRLLDQQATATARLGRFERL